MTTDQVKRRQIAWILILIVDVAYVAWGAMAAVMPDGLLGPGGKAILPDVRPHASRPTPSQ